MEQAVLEPGALAEVVAAGGEVITRRIVAVERGRVFVCTDQEYEAAKRERREPICVGFRPDCVHIAS